MSAEPAAVAAWLDAMPPDRRELVGAVLAVVRANLPDGYVEALHGGMLTWTVPLSVYPDTYNGQPFLYAALANQKGHVAAYLCNVYGLPDVRAAFEADAVAEVGRLDMGGSCVRFKKLAAAPLGAIGRAVAATPMDVFVAHGRAVRAATRSAKRGG